MKTVSLGSGLLKASGILKGVIWASTSIALLALFAPPADALYWFLCFHFSGFIATGLLAIALQRNWLGWSLAAFWIPFLPSLWLTFRPENRPENMTASDNCWYNMERDVNHMMVVGLMFFDTAPERAALEKLLQERLLSFDRFRQVPRLSHGVRQWQFDENFRLDRHLEYVPLETQTEQAFSDRVNALAGEKLDFTRPLWHMQIVPNHPAGAALILRIHHCIADGIALVRVLLSMTVSDPAQQAETNERETLAASVPRASTPPLVLLKELLQAFPRMLMRPDSRTSFKKALSGERRTAWSKPLPLAQIKAIARSHHGKINDVVLAATAGALRRYFMQHNEPLEGATFRVLVPINMRPLTGPVELGNKVGFIYLPLPVGCSDPHERLHQVKAAMDAIKTGKESYLSYISLCFLGTLPRTLQHLIIDVFNQNASSTMTNVPGPREKLYFAGQAITHMNFFGPQSGKMGVGISVFSYQDELTMGITADAGMVPCPDLFTACFEQEIAEWPHATGH